MRAMEPSWVDNKSNYQDVARGLHPGARLVTKDSWFFKVLAIFAAPFVGYRYWLEHYAIALGPVQAYPRQWTDLRMGTIIHECRHSWQCEMLGWLIPIVGWFFGRTVRTWAGFPLFLILYFVVLLPIGLSVFKCWFELDADRAKWAWMLIQGEGPQIVELRAIDFGKTVNGRGYGFAFPWLGRKWFRWAAKRLISKWQARSTTPKK